MLSLRSPTAKTYYPAGRLQILTVPGSTALNYIYDGALPLSESLTGAVNGSVTRAYTNDFNLSSLSVNGATIPFAYDNDGLLTQAGSLTLTRNAQNGLLNATTLGATTTSHSYTGFGEASQFTALYAGSTLLDVQYTRDNAGRITQKTETVSGQTATYGYSYDQVGRLTGVTKNGISTATYTYDQNGNRLSRNGVTGSYDDQDRLLSYGANTYRYTANGERTTKTSTGQTTSYTYDVFGNLTQATLPTGTVIDYIIDGRNRRVGKKINGTLTQGFLYQDQLKPIAELDGSGNIVSRFVYVTGINVPDYIINGTTSYRIITDHLGSPRLIINTTDGTITQRLDYDEFGNITQDTHPGFQPFGFAGGLYDRDTQLTRFGARDYDADTGKWTAKDPIRFGGGDANLYTYVGNNPLSYIDPYGLWAIGDPLPQGVVDFSAGLGDALLLGAGGYLRDLAGVDGGVDPCSDAYKNGAWSSFALGAGRLAYAGLAKAGSVLAVSGSQASAFRQGLKGAFRLGAAKNWRPPDLSKYPTDDALRAAAGRTNPAMNAYGAGVAAAGAYGGSGCGCSR